MVRFGLLHLLSMILPRPLIGKSRMEVWLMKLRDAIEASQVCDSPDIRWHRSPRGSTAQIIKLPSAAGGSEVQRFKIKSISDNWLVCRKVDEDDVETSSTDFKVMRPIMLRKDKALPSGASAGSLAYPADQERTFTITTTVAPIKTVTVRQVMTPKYVANEFIYGADGILGGTVDDGAGAQVEWIDLNIDARKWDMALKLVAVCVTGNVTQYALAQITDPVA